MSGSALDLSPKDRYYNLHLLRQQQQNLQQQRLMNSMLTRDERVRFALFIKILFKRLEESGQVVLHQRAKQLLRCITSGNKAGDPGCTPVVEVLETRLRGLVGESHWRRSHLLMRMYLSRNQHVLPSSSRHYHPISYAA